jgi:transketolase
MAWGSSERRCFGSSKNGIKQNRGSNEMNGIAMRDAFFARLYEIARSDRNVILLSADFGAVSLDKFRKDLSSQFINTGVAEQNMVTIATGLALSGKKVYTYSLIPFATLRCYEHIKIDLSLMNVPVTIVGVGSGFSYDDSGPTHHGTEDITLMRALPNMTILNSSDSIMAGKFAELSYKVPGPSYVRLDRELLPLVYGQEDDFFDGLAHLKTGKDVVIVASGNMVHRALEVSERLAEHSIDVGLIDLYRIKPINAKLLLERTNEAKLLVTLEEHLLAGGIGSAVIETVVDSGKKLNMMRFGIQDRYYYAYGGRRNIQRLCRLDTETITESILRRLECH